MTGIGNLMMWTWTSSMVVLVMAVAGNKDTDQFMSMTTGFEFLFYNIYIEFSYVIYFFKVSPWKCHVTYGDEKPSDSTLTECNLKFPFNGTNYCEKLIDKFNVVRRCGPGRLDLCKEFCFTAVKDDKAKGVATGDKACQCCTEGCNSANFTRGLMRLNAFASISLTIFFSLM